MDPTIIEMEPKQAEIEAAKLANNARRGRVARPVAPEGSKVCSVCVVVRTDDYFVQDNKQYKTCNPCRAKQQARQQAKKTRLPTLTPMEDLVAANNNIPHEDEEEKIQEPGKIKFTKTRREKLTLLVSEIIEAMHVADVKKEKIARILMSL